jgi:hypothetical protein
MQLRREVSGSLLVLWKPVQGEQRVIDVGMIYPSRGCTEIGHVIFHMRYETVLWYDTNERRAHTNCLCRGL